LVLYIGFVNSSIIFYQRPINPPFFLFNIIQ
jgi:hypothetical protein